MLRILFLIPDLRKGGAERFLIDLCRELKKREDIEFVIGLLSDTNQYTNDSLELPLVQLNYKLFSFRSKNECFEFQEILNSFKPDIIHSNLFLAEFLSSFYLSKSIKYVCHGHDNMAPFENLSFSTLINKRKRIDFLEKTYLILKKYLFHKTYFIANSKHTHDYYKRSLPFFMKNNVHLIRYGFDFMRFHYSKTRVWNFGDKIKIINVGSFQDKKNQKFIVEIGRELLSRGFDFEINLLGDGQNKEAVQRAVDQNGLEDYIILHGNVDNVEEWLWKCDIYLHTAFYEPFGLVFLEAMAAGLPIVTMDGKGNRDIIQNGKNGYIIEVEDEKVFADKILKIMTEKNLYNTLSSNGVNFAQRFNIVDSTDSLIKFYRSIIN